MKKRILNILFPVVSAIILIVLLKAPEKSTTPLPRDKGHQRFFTMKKKEAEKYCLDCHGEDEVYPLTADHPSKNRCLFCHTRE